LQAKSNNGQWLLRIEDLDPPREAVGAADAICFALEAHELYWNGSVIYQSDRVDLYQEVLDQLLLSSQAYPCSCSRKEIEALSQPGASNHVYPGTCRDGPQQPNREQFSYRLRTKNAYIAFDDIRVGRRSQHLQRDIGDFVIKRADGLFAYQLAVVVDDAQQHVTEIVRGEDLLPNTPRQIYLQIILGYSTPQYLHLPLVTNPQGQKLSKQNHAPALDTRNARGNIIAALRFLGHPPPTSVLPSQTREILDWAIKNWELEKLPFFASLKSEY